MAVELRINGQTQIVDADASTPLLYALRNDLGLNGPRFGCGLAQCGACTVLADGTPIRSCVTPLAAVAESEITTIEGLGNRDAPHTVQAAFIAEQAAQCGFCASGMIMTAAALLEDDPNPTEQQIRQALDGNLCRCGTHVRILRAVRRAAQAMA